MSLPILAGLAEARLNSCAIVVPCYNESARLQPDLFVRYASNPDDINFIFVDDGSTDDTGTILRAMCERNSSALSVLTLERNSGKAEAVRRGMVAALEGGHSYCGYWDADLATPLSAVAAFIGRFEQNPGVAVVMGSRIRLLGRKIERKWFRHYIGRIFATAASAILGFAVYDTQCGAKLFRNCVEVRSALERPFLSRWLFDVELLLRLKSAFRDPDFSKTGIEEPLEEWRDVAGSKIPLSYFFVIPTALFSIWIRHSFGKNKE